MKINDTRHAKPLNKQPAFVMTVPLLFKKKFFIEQNWNNMSMAVWFLSCQPTHAALILTLFKVGRISSLLATIKEVR